MSSEWKTEVKIILIFFHVNNKRGVWSKISDIAFIPLPKPSISYSVTPLVKNPYI